MVTEVYRDIAHAASTRAVLLRDALEKIAAASIPDQPASSAGDGEAWARQHVAKLRGIAEKALREYEAALVASV